MKKARKQGGQQESKEESKKESKEARKASKKEREKERKEARKAKAVRRRMVSLFFGFKPNALGMTRMQQRRTDLGRRRFGRRSVMGSDIFYRWISAAWRCVALPRGFAVWHCCVVLLRGCAAFMNGLIFSTPLISIGKSSSITPLVPAAGRNARLLRFYLAPSWTPPSKSLFAFFLHLSVEFLPHPGANTSATS